jgi:hypothetical protein
VASKSVDVKYGITELGDMRWVWDVIERDRTARTIYISREAFVNSILTRFNLTDAVSLSTLAARGCVGNIR